MQSEQSEYLHQPVWGLPKSLLKTENGTVTAITLMAKAGLNRDMRRRHNLNEAVYLPFTLDPKMLGVIPNSEWNLLTHYLSTFSRFYSFWNALKDTRTSTRFVGSLYILAIDIHLLQAYEENWQNLKLDEAKLIEACTEWHHIRKRIESKLKKKEKLPYGLFMLWPRIAEELTQWTEIDSDRRLTISRAVFALSSVGFTNWFIEQALSICSELEFELGGLLTHATEEVVIEAPQQIVDAPFETEARLVEEETETGQESEEWKSLLERLESLCEELKANPTQEALSDLIVVAKEIESHRVKLPKREQAASERLNTHLEILIHHIRSLSSREGFQWLDEELTNQIESRWLLSARDSDSPEHINELSNDAVSAINRCDLAAVELEDALRDIESSINTVRETTATIESAKGYTEQAAANRKHRAALKQQLDAESRKQSVVENLIDAASPFGEPFDHSCDYCALLQGTPTLEVEPEASSVESPSEQPQTEIAPLSGPTSPLVPETVEVPTTPHPLVEAGSSTQRDDAGSPFQSNAIKDTPDEPNHYNDTAGEACRPIWRLLSCDQPALAFNAASWINSETPDLKIPSRDLLAAVALEGSLMLPDGGIQSAMSACFERLEPEDFAEQTPKAWHAAVNLMLASATMRAMILAPRTGASSVAEYLHHDGNYPALYELIQQLRELSPLLMGFRFEPVVFRQARGEATIRAELHDLQHSAEDWLRMQAPAYTIKFAPATSVWRHWLKAGGEIDALVSPVEHNRISDASGVTKQVAMMSNRDYVLRLIQDTDRKTLKRRRGEDIHAGALEHLFRIVDEALRLARQWLGLIELLGQQGNRVRNLLEKVHSEISDRRPAVEAELLCEPEDDPWGLVAAGQKQALRAMRGVLRLFDSDTELQSYEPSAAEVIGYPLLLISDLPVKDNWTSDVTPNKALEALGHWLEDPLNGEEAARRRLERGDVLGAELLVQVRMADAQSILIRQERDRWKQALRKEISECRRSVEVGSAYGYLVDADRGQYESRLAYWEEKIEDVRQFDLAITELRDTRAQVDRAREVRADEVREALKNAPQSEGSRTTALEIEKALNEGDIATANELVDWLVQGRAMPTELDENSQNSFEDFFPNTMQTIESWLEGQRRDAIEQAIKKGEAIPGLEVRRVAGAQLNQASKMFSSWLDMKAQLGADKSQLELLITGLGLTVKSLTRTEKVSGREVWMLDAQTVEDRQICAIPTFGSAAAGKYRVVCVWGRPTEDELLQYVGDSTVSRSTFLLYFGRMTDRKWRDLSRLSKSKRRAFVLLDETLLVYLCHASGSRLRAWLDTSLPFSYSSPYDATAGLVPPEMFYGRGVELDAVRGLNGRCFIYGGRQLGKTALLKRAEQSFHAPAHGHYAKWIDLRAEGIGVSRAASELWITLYEKLTELRVLDSRIAAPLPGKKNGVEVVMREIRAFLNIDSDRRVLLLLDEADRFFEQDGRNDFEDTRRLKQLMDETSRRFKVVFAGLHNVLRMTEHPNHPLAHFGEPIEIGPLREGEEIREAADLIRRPMAAAGFEFEHRSLVIRILAQTNYYPSLIQLYCSHLLRHMLSQVATRHRPNGPRYIVNDRDIEKVYSSDALRDEIRAKFRLTLQLDPRYEVIAYSMAYDLLKNRYTQSAGMSWQTIRQSGAMHWWPEGFRDTGELDFRVLLDEMVGLGVLGSRSGGNYVLRNPNVLLLLGNQGEIEAVLVKDREPTVEFESASFFPPLNKPSARTEHNVFTYQQISKLLQRANTISVVTGTLAAGIGGVMNSLSDYLKEAAPVVLTNCNDRHSFGVALSSALNDRQKDRVTCIVVPDTTPWTDLWIADAQQRIERLKSGSNFASLVFVAEPPTLWRLLRDESELVDGQPPWMSLLHWKDSFMRHWLEERHLQLESEDRRQLSEVTGNWPKLILDVAGDCTELRTLRDRMKTTEARWFSNKEQLSHWRLQLGLNVPEPLQVIELLARLGEPVGIIELSALGEMPEERVKASLRWGELLGLVQSEGADFWTVDPIIGKTLLSNEN